MKVGSLVYATDQGLGILAKSFVDNGVVTDVVVVRHGRHKEHDDWYLGSQRVADLRSSLAMTEIKAFCARMDVMLFFETPFVWGLIDHCREVGTKTALMVMHECLHERVKRHTPDLFLCPSMLDAECSNRVIRRCERRGGVRVEFLPVPVDVPHRQRRRAEVFVHNAGWGGLKGRNGTAELVEAFLHVRSPAKLLLRSQAPFEFPEKLVANLNIERQIGTIQHADLWNLGGIGDVFLFPEKFNGLSLPLQEARAAGMLVICGDRFPMNEWLPREPLIPVAGYHRERVGPPYPEYDCAEFDTLAIAAKIDQWYGRDISECSAQGAAWAETMSWKTLKPKYVKVLEDLVNV